jgi:hypothetical protein
VFHASTDRSLSSIQIFFISKNVMSRILFPITTNMSLSSTFILQRLVDLPVELIYIILSHLLEDDARAYITLFEHSRIAAILHEDFPRQIRQIIHHYPASHRQSQRLLLTTCFFASRTAVPRSTRALRESLDRSLHADDDNDIPQLYSASAAVIFLRSYFNLRHEAQTIAKSYVHLTLVQAFRRSNPDVMSKKDPPTSTLWASTTDYYRIMRAIHRLQLYVHIGKRYQTTERRHRKVRALFSLWTT